MCLASPTPCGRSSTLTYGPNGRWMGFDCRVHACFTALQRLFVFRDTLISGPFWVLRRHSPSTYAPMACVWPSECDVGGHVRSHIVPMADGWALIAGYMPASLPCSGFLC